MALIAHRHLKSAGTLACALMLTACSKIDDPTLSTSLDINEPPPTKPIVPYTNTRNLFWGDLHIHSSLSFDAYTVGVRVMPEDAYHYMKGGTIEHAAGYLIRAGRPLDFGAVTDHAQYLGIPRHRAGSDAEDSQLPEIVAQGNAVKYTWYWLGTMLDKMIDWEATFGDDSLRSVSVSAWQQIIEAAERHNDPGRFTTFIGYEWTSMPGDQNLHRNVIYKTSQVPEFPFSARDSENPEDLWDALDAQRKKGMENFAIPHNANLSNGLMYDQVSYEGNAFNADYARQRMENEPISELLQIKGTSETHPSLSPDDQFADYEIYGSMLDRGNTTGKVKGSYVRDALRLGLEFNHQQGFNPYQFGVIGSSDSHNGSFAVEENNYHGKAPMLDGTPAIRQGKLLLLPDEMRRGGLWAAQGLAAVWAEENTRASIFNAMRRKETYATSGPRISLRFFGGWQYSEDMLEASDWLTSAYEGGVPMGGVLEQGDVKTAPRFVVFAGKDPVGANLDRIQIIKAWVDENGASQEKVFDVKASGSREINLSTGFYDAVGNTVDSKDATYSNTIGSEQLAVVWTDPEFNRERGAFYYARVLEIPTPRYSTFDAKALGIKAPDPASIQERAISSAIWYQP